MPFLKNKIIKFQVDSLILNSFFKNVDSRFLERGCFFELTNLGFIIVTKDKDMNFAIGCLIPQPKVDIKFSFGVSSKNFNELIKNLKDINNSEKVGFELHYKSNLMKKYKKVEVKRMMVITKTETIKCKKEKPFPKLLGDDEYLSFEIDKKIFLGKINNLNLGKNENLVEMNFLSKNKKIVMKSIKSRQELNDIDIKGDTAVYKLNIEKFKYFVNQLNDNKIKIFLHAIFFTSLGSGGGLKFFTFVTGKSKNEIIYVIPSLVISPVAGQAKFGIGTVIHSRPTSF